MATDTRNNINNENAAKQIIDAAIQLNTSVYKCLNLFSATEGYEPKLTDEECKSISVNYPYSWQQVRQWFDRRI